MESKDPVPLEAPIRDPQTLKSRILFQRTITRKNHTKMYETLIFNFLLNFVVFVFFLIYHGDRKTEYRMYMIL